MNLFKDLMYKFDNHINFLEIDDKYYEFYLKIIINYLNFYKKNNIIDFLRHK